MAEKEKEIKAINPKMRIQLLDDNLVPLSDRLVDQKIELSTGPKFTHKGPVRLEVTISTKNDGSDFKSYLSRISEDKPELVKGTRGRKPSDYNEVNISPREDILEDILKMAEEPNSQDKIIKHLRELGYVFILTEDFKSHFPEFPFKSKHTGKPNNNGQYPDSYCWMVRRIKYGKDPKTDKFDPQLIFGFTLLPERKSKVVSYLFKEFKTSFHAQVPKKNAFTFESFEMAKFPAYMTTEEREKWQREHRMYQADPEKKHSKFYDRWLPDIILPNMDFEK